MPTTRYAPSPTGRLHLGHVAHLLYVWGVAQARGAHVLLRMEDHDSSRSRPEFERSILEDLDWLGFAPANELTAEFRQSDSHAAYDAALERLRARARVYACDCTRAAIAARIEPNADGERPYDGHCRERALPLTNAALRVVSPQGVETFQDEFLGPQRQTPASQSGDLLIRDRAGQWTYQFAVVVDDLRHGVDLIVRGEDLLASTGRQLALARQLGSEQQPLYFHHPLILDDEGVKLSKRTAAGPIRERRIAGAEPADIIGEAARRVGLTDRSGPLALDEALSMAATWVSRRRRREADNEEPAPFS